MPTSRGLVRAAAVALALLAGSAWPGASIAWQWAATPSPNPALPPASSSAEFSVPDSIDATGSSDAVGPLAIFLGSVPDGSTVVFRSDGIYRLDSAIRLIDRRDLTFAGNGATLRATGSGGDIGDSPFFLQRSTGIVIRDFTMVGNNPDAGTAASHHLERQDQGGVMVYGGGDILVEGTTVRGMWGDCVYVDADAGVWADGVTYRDSLCELNGRMGVALIAARNVLVERVHFDAISMHVLDIEPNFVHQGAIGVVFRDNIVGTYGLSSLFTCYFFAANGAAGSTVRNVTVTANTVSGGTLATSVEVPWRHDIAFTFNTSPVAARGPVLRFAHVDGVTVRGNEQPLVSGPLMTDTQLPGSRRLAPIALVAGIALIGLVGLAVLTRRRRAIARRTNR